MMKTFKVNVTALFGSAGLWTKDYYIEAEFQNEAEAEAMRLHIEATKDEITAKTYNTTEQIKVVKV